MSGAGPSQPPAAAAVKQHVFTCIGPPCQELNEGELERAELAWQEELEQIEEYKPLYKGKELRNLEPFSVQEVSCCILYVAEFSARRIRRRKLGAECSGQNTRSRVF
jgi:hypothetical protein